MNEFTDQNYLLNQQYKSSENLNYRIQLHKKYSTNKYGFLTWIFDQFDFHSNFSILEIGCGTGELWLQNLGRFGFLKKIILSDISLGMIRVCKTALSHHHQPFEFSVVDAQCLPYFNNEFDAVIANHMLYHVPDLQNTIDEIVRVLKPTGTFYATTNGKKHLQELKQLMEGYSKKYKYKDFTPLNFTLENAKQILNPLYKTCVVRRYEDSLLVTNAEDLLDYQLSRFYNEEDLSTVEGKKRLLEYFKGKIERKNGIKIGKDSGIVICSNSYNS
ncbi:MAG: class I SAM-dependent methyltransferase [Candidatus Hodarchaeales archaeon]